MPHTLLRLLGGCWLLTLAACNIAAAPEPTTVPITSEFRVNEADAAQTATNTPAVVSRPSRTPISNVPPTSVPFSGVSGGGSSSIPTSAPPPQAVEPIGGGLTQLLTNGRGLTTGRPVTNGEFEVEGYCTLLDPANQVSENGFNWFCLRGGQRVRTLTIQDFDEICRRTYNEADALAVQLPGPEPAAYRWRCYVYTITPTPRPLPTSTPFPTSAPAARLIALDNGRGLSTGAVMTNGEFEVEGYCTILNASYGVDRDNDNWFCTQNGQRVRTLSPEDFNEICRRTYNRRDAFAAQQGTSTIPVFRWRCYVFEN